MPKKSLPYQNFVTRGCLKKPHLSRENLDLQFEGTSKFQNFSMCEQ